ncbi:hypothetical protein TNCV_1963871 [Trichonephila clavipes]|nr:hypothetical protein TNCV_1963871 [Trichonephila clavipes]
MAALTETWPTIEIRSVTWLSHLKKNSPADINHQLVEVYGTSVISRRQVWFGGEGTEIDKGRRDVRVEERALSVGVDLYSIKRNRIPNFRSVDLIESSGNIVNIQTATAGSDVVQSGRPIFDDFFQHLWPYMGNITANVVFQMVKRLWLIRIDQ